MMQHEEQQEPEIAVFVNNNTAGEAVSKEEAEETEGSRFSDEGASPPGDGTITATTSTTSDSTTATTTATTAAAAAARFPFPKAFYDPRTNKIMANPVVGPDGVSYEKESDDLEAGVDDYPNRALQSYIEDQLERFSDNDDGSVRSTLMQWGQSLRSGWQQLLEGEYRPLPDAFYCPISFDLMHEPVIDPDGMSYEKAAIYYWLQNNNDSPVTRNPLTVDQLRENKALLQVLDHLTQPEEPEAIHPSVRKWKTEHSTRQPFAPESLPPATNTATTTTDATADGTQTNTNPTQSFAANQEQLEARRRQRKICSDRLWTGWSFLFLIVVFFFPSYVLLFILLTVAVYIVEKVYTVRRDIQDRRAQMIAHQQEIQAAQAALAGGNANLQQSQQQQQQPQQQETTAEGNV